MAKRGACPTKNWFNDWHWTDVAALSSKFTTGEALPLCRAMFDHETRTEEALKKTEEQKIKRAREQEAQQVVESEKSEQASGSKLRKIDDCEDMSAADQRFAAKVLAAQRKALGIISVKKHDHKK